MPDEPTSDIERFLNDGQDRRTVAGVYERVSGILTRDEEIAYIAVQDKPLLDVTPTCVIITNRRFIIYEPHLLGRAEFTDYIWRDLRDVRLVEDVIGATLSLSTVDGEAFSVDYLPKAQARRLYALTQEKEEEVREERRQRELEERRAEAGGIMLQGQAAPLAPQQAAEPSEPSEPDAARTLQKLKDLLDAGLITQEEYDAKKAEILAGL